MLKKYSKYGLIIIVILMAAVVSYFYLTEFYLPKQEEEKTVYAAEDFPNALQMMEEEILQMSLDDLNKQYRKLAEGDEYVYIRWINIGILKKRLGDIMGAEKAWLKAAEYNPDQSLAYGNLADLYQFDLEENKKSEEYYQKVLSMPTYSYNYYLGLATLYRYRITEKTGLIEGLMLEGAERVPAEVENYYMYLANYFDQDGHDQEKAKYYTQKTLELNPDLKDQLPDL